MSGKGDVAADVADDAVEEVLTDHHLDEVAEMIEQAQAHKRSSETPSSDIPAEYPRNLL